MRFLILILGLSLAACGGGNGGDSTPAPIAEDEPGHGVLTVLSGTVADLNSHALKFNLLVADSAQKVAVDDSTTLRGKSTVYIGGNFEDIQEGRTVTVKGQLVGQPWKGLLKSDSIWLQ